MKRMNLRNHTRKETYQDYTIPVIVDNKNTVQHRHINSASAAKIWKKNKRLGDFCEKTIKEMEDKKEQKRQEENRRRIKHTRMLLAKAKKKYRK